MKAIDTINERFQTYLNQHPNRLRFITGEEGKAYAFCKNLTFTNAEWTNEGEEETKDRLLEFVHQGKEWWAEYEAGSFDNGSWSCSIPTTILPAKDRKFVYNFFEESEIALYFFAVMKEKKEEKAAMLKTKIIGKVVTDVVKKPYRDTYCIVFENGEEQEICL